MNGRVRGRQFHIWIYRTTLNLWFEIVSWRLSITYIAYSRNAASLDMAFAAADDCPLNEGSDWMRLVSSGVENNGKIFGSGIGIIF